MATTQSRTIVKNENRTHAVLGTDTEGAIHHLAEHEARVLVIDPETGEIEFVQYLSPEDLDLDTAGWITHVAKKRGWVAGTRKYICNSALFTHLAEATGTEADR